MTIASWLVTFEAGQERRRAPSPLQPSEIECRSEAKSSLVVLSQSPSGAGVESVRELLRTVPWVRDAALVTSFEDEEPH